MTDENKAANIEAELARSEACLRECKLLLSGGLAEGAVSRLYYALFHAVVALLLTEGLEPRSHAGLTSLLGLHFVRTGVRAPPRPHPSADRRSRVRSVTSNPFDTATSGV